MNDTFMEENAIITRCLNGDTEAFEMIVTRYQEPLMALCWNILRNPEEARDTTQDTFVQAFRHLNRYDQVRSLKNWLYSIAYHRCLDKIRKHKSFLRNSRMRSNGSWAGSLSGSGSHCF